jgi:hypothetical protein
VVGVREAEQARMTTPYGLGGIGHAESREWVRAPLRAQQSSIPARKDSGLLRCARNTVLKQLRLIAEPVRAVPGGPCDHALIQVFCPTSQVAFGNTEIANVFNPIPTVHGVVFQILVLERWRA